jgi:hypothetical protein
VYQRWNTYSLARPFPKYLDVFLQQMHIFVNICLCFYLFTFSLRNSLASRTHTDLSLDLNCSGGGCGWSLLRIKTDFAHWRRFKTLWLKSCLKGRGVCSCTLKLSPQIGLYCFLSWRCWPHAQPQIWSASGYHSPGLYPSTCLSSLGDTTRSLRPRWLSSWSVQGSQTSLAKVGGGQKYYPL